MTMEISFAAIVSFFYILTMLIGLSFLDLKDRRVPNNVMLVSVILGTAISIVTGHFIEHLFLHVFAVLISMVIGLLLFRLKAIGGADAKSLVLIALVSPGIEFGVYDSIIFEVTIGGLIPVFFMLLCGYLYSIKRSQEQNDSTPLIPFLLIGYLLVQLVAFI